MLLQKGLQTELKTVRSSFVHYRYLEYCGVVGFSEVTPEWDMKTQCMMPRTSSNSRKERWRYGSAGRDFRGIRLRRARRQYDLMRPLYEYRVPARRKDRGMLTSSPSTGSPLSRSFEIPN